MGLNGGRREESYDLPGGFVEGLVIPVADDRFRAVFEGIPQPVMTAAMDSFSQFSYTWYYKWRPPALKKTELSDPIAMRIPVDVLAQIEAVAAATERTRSWVMVRALRYYLGGEGREILAAIDGRRQIAEGKSHDMDEVITELDAIADGTAA